MGLHYAEPLAIIKQAGDGINTRGITMKKKKPTIYQREAHTFVICAYGSSPYLEECIRSTLAQTIKTQVIIATSTPNEVISFLAQKYSIRLCINQGESGLAGDWNFAYQCAHTPLVTLAHQDDRYYENYTEDVLTALNSCFHPLLVFTDYNELREGQTVLTNPLLRIKRMMLWPMKIAPFRGVKWIRRRVLSLGNAISCPTVTFVKDNLPDFTFKNNMKSNIDWQAWEELSRRKGEFVYISKPCMEHRIHPNSTTTSLLEINGRQREDLQMLRKFWPEWLANIIEYFYKYGEKSNKLR